MLPIFEEIPNSFDKLPSDKEDPCFSQARNKPQYYPNQRFGNRSEV